MSTRSKIIDDSSDSDVEFKVNENYAEKYNTWREKEELQKLKARYGDDAELSSSSSSSEEDEEELNSVIDKQFLKTLSCLKSKAPEIYDEKTRFFPVDGESLEPKKKRKKKKESTMYLKDYENKILLEKNGILTDEDDDGPGYDDNDFTYTREQEKIKESFKELMEDPDSDDELLQEKVKPQKDKIEEESEYLKWLKEEDNSKTSKDLKYLKDYWNNPKLEESEAFLRDYILNKSYLDKGNKENANNDDDEEDALSVSEDEKILEQMEEFEHKFNFRFEEPDEEFIKRFPRTINNTLRRKDPKRKKQREDYRERKKEEKDKKKEELKRFKALKRKEITDKLEQLKEITGNEKLSFDDLDEDFDPDKYDNRMKQVFNEDYYGEEDDAKPEFPFDEDIDGDENWDSWKGNQNFDDGNVTPHCEDNNFNMDAEYDPQSELKKDMVNASKKSRRKSKFAEILSQKKPTFDPSENTYEEYLDEYYKLDFEDIVGDMPVRFPYRTTVPNDFGLSVEEILAAHDRELNQWCSIKKTCQYRTEQEEKYDVQAFHKKADNASIKQKILPSLFQTKEEGDNLSEAPKRKRKRKNKIKSFQRDGDTVVQKDLKTNETSSSTDKSNTGEIKITERQQNGTNTKLVKGSGSLNISQKARKRYQPDGGELINGLNVTDDRLRAYGLNPKKIKNKIKHRKK